MNDPHVVALLYSIEHDDSVDYSEARQIEHEEEPFRVTIEDKVVRFELKDHYAREDAAREAVESYIRCWELETALRGRPGQFNLRFDRAEIVDRNPPPPTPGVVNISAHIRAGVPTVRATVTVTTPKPYPSPPSGVTLDPYDPDAMTMFYRFEGYLENKEPLTSMAYFCLTMLDGYLCNGRRAAARTYGIDKNVLGMIGNLTANKGGRGIARKASGIGFGLAREESRFLEEAVKAIILRVAAIAHDPEKRRPKITLSDLPAVST